MAALTRRLGRVRPHFRVRGWAIWRVGGVLILAVVVVVGMREKFKGYRGEGMGIKVGKGYHNKMH